MGSFKRSVQFVNLSLLGAGTKIFKNTRLHGALTKAMAEKMTEMKGLPMKMSQILGMGESDLGEVHRQALQGIEPIPLEEVKASLQESFPELLEGVTFHPEVYCASLGQVFHITKNGKDYALKMQYPDSEKNMELDEKALKLMTSTFSGFSKGFNLSEYERVLKEELNLELDYVREFRMQMEFLKFFADDARIVIPMPLQKYSHDNILFMSWEPSLKFDEFLKVATISQKKAAADLVTKFYLESTLKHRFIHADPNPGNFGFRLLENGGVQLVVYDFGSVVEMSEKQHLALLGLFAVTLQKGSPLPVLKQLGFNGDLLRVIESKLLALMEVLLQPFLEEVPFHFVSWERKRRVEAILGEERWNFMAAAPAELFLFMRALKGLFYYNEQLTGEIFCRGIIDENLKLFQVKICEIIGKEKVKDLQTNFLSKYLVISVKENGAQKVKLTFPVHAVENLRDLVPPEVEEKLRRQGLQIEHLVENARRNQFSPQSLFKLVDKGREIDVYLS